MEVGSHTRSLPCLCLEIALTSCQKRCVLLPLTGLQIVPMCPKIYIQFCRHKHDWKNTSFFARSGLERHLSPGNCPRQVSWKEKDHILADLVLSPQTWDYQGSLSPISSCFVEVGSHIHNVNIQHTMCTVKKLHITRFASTNDANRDDWVASINRNPIMHVIWWLGVSVGMHRV